MDSRDLDLVLELLALHRERDVSSIAERRLEYDRAASAFAEDTPGIAEDIVAGGVAAEWIPGPIAGSKDVILYLHGGGYHYGSPRSHRHLAAALGRAASASVIVPEYRLAPEHQCPSAVEDLVSVYCWLLRSKFSTTQIAFAGDSAGGGLVVAGMLALRDSGERLPAAGICISPWVDLTGTSQSHVTHEPRDPALRARDLARMASSYLGGMDSRDPIASPLFGDLRGLPPLLIHVGTEEILINDARELASRAEAAGVEVTLLEWPQMFHAWHWYFPLLEEGSLAVQYIGSFLKDRFRALQNCQ